MKLYATITKIDEAQRMVFGYASTEALDSQGEIVKREALEAALPDYMRFANIREMHQPSAVGVATEAELDGRGLYLGAKIVDPVAWEKVSSGVYKGFSIGGTVVSRDHVNKHVITGVKLSEISLVDRPANPEAVFTMYKDAGHKAGAASALAKVGARNSAADLGLIQDIHDRAVALGADCPGCGSGDQDGADQDDATANGEDFRDSAKIAGLIAERDALRKALGRQPAPRRAALRAMPIAKSADHGGASETMEQPTRDPLELAKRALRRPMSLAQIEKLANGGSGLA
jgi:phage head maturation protease